MKQAVLFSILIFSISIQVSAQVENLSELALFNRCYANITGTRLPFKHPLRASVVSRTLTAVNACMQVLDSGKLNSSPASAEGRMASDTPQGRLVLQRFNDFHRTWFPTDDFGAALPQGLTFNALTRFIYDQGESALHVTRTLFTAGVNYSDVVVGKYSMEALRTSGPIQNPGAPPKPTPTTYFANKSIGLKIALAQATSYTDPTRVYLQTELVQFGDLLGLRPINLNPVKYNLSVIGTHKEGNYPRYMASIKTHESLGGGFLGTKSYLLMNLGRSEYSPMDGGLRVPRRWARAAINTLLCRDLPVIRRADSEPFVQAAGIPFRQSTNCMQCHASMDRFSYTARNISYNTIPMLTDAGNMQASVWPATEPAETGQVTADNKFHLRPTNGVLFYRSYDGRLIDQNVKSIAELGNAFAANNEMYVCAASRYFKFFTGIDVNLNDIGDTSKPTMTAAEIKYRDLVIALGIELKSTQSLRILIQKILSSDIYRRSSLE
ncbi:MAG: hypothetical protein AABY64_07005 [Bdellovibrionota bacterium]